MIPYARLTYQTTVMRQYIVDLGFFGYLVHLPLREPFLPEQGSSR